jgi:serine/threonine-protein kinase RsbW
MENELVQVTRLGDLGNIAKLSPRGSSRDISLVPCILAAFEEAFKQKVIYFVIDLSQIKDLPPSLIVLLFELTARARRRGGDLQIVKLGSIAQHNLLTFNPLSYLSATNDEEEAVDDIETRLRIDQRQDAEYSVGPRYLPSSPIKIATVPTIQKSSIEIPSTVDALYRACDFVIDAARRMHFEEAEIGKIKLAVYEACLNAVEHAYRSDPSRAVKVAVETSPEKLVIAVIDQGQGFNVDRTKDFDVIEAALNRKTGGMGLHIIRRSVDEVRYEMDPLVGNKLIMIKNLHKLSKLSI